MNQTIKDIFILILLLIILFQRCGSSNTKKPVEQHFRDTTLIKLSGDTSITTITPTKIIPYIYTSKDTLYIPDTTNKEKFKEQYYALRDSLLATKIYNDTFKIATLGDAHIQTTVFNNAIKEQKFNYNIKYPIIKDCVIVTASPRTQLYFGVGVLGNQKELVKGAEINLSLKNKKDQIYEIGSQYINGEVIYKMGTKWKVKL